MSEPRAALFRPRLGLCLIFGYIFVVATWIVSKRPEEGLWLSHLSLMLAGIGFRLASPIVLGGTLVGIFVFHSIWSFDALTWLLTGNFPMGVTRYLEASTPLQWIATLHHFFVFPLLAITLLRARAFSMAAWPAACIAFALAVIFARVFTPEAANVNGAFAPPPGLEGTFLDPILDGARHLSQGWGDWSWALVMIAGCSLGNFLPVAIMFALLQAWLPDLKARATLTPIR